jgi:hypothetical protein
MNRPLGNAQNDLAEKGHTGAVELLNEQYGRGRSWRIIWGHRTRPASSRS